MPKPIPHSRTCDEHGLPHIPGLEGCWYCTYGNRRVENAIPLPPERRLKPRTSRSTVARVAEAILSGKCVIGAAGHAGVHTSTVYRWFRQGRKGRWPYNEFYHAVTKASSDFAPTESFPLGRGKCHGCKAPVDPRCTWCASCKPSSRNVGRRPCPDCGERITTRYARKCDSCRVPPACAPYDAARKAARHARGLKYRHWLTLPDGRRMHFEEAARQLGVKPDALSRRLKKGLPLQDAIEGAKKVA